MAHEEPAFCAKGLRAPLGKRPAGVHHPGSVPAATVRPKRKKKLTCDDCFFRRNLLCALPLDEPCATFRPDRPEGLVPPRQLMLVFREERRPQRLTGFRQLA